MTDEKKWFTFDNLLNVEVFIAGLLLIFIVLSVCYDVFMRFLMNQPQKWVIETSEYSLLFITFLVAAWVLKEDKHVVVDIVFNKLSRKRQALLRIFSSSIVALIASIFIIFGFQVFVEDWIKGVYNPTPLELYRAPIILIIPVGSIFLFVQAIRKLMDYARVYKQLKS